MNAGALIRAEVDLAAIAHNVRALAGCVSPGTRFMAVVKADAYGHGAAAVARVALDHGASWLGVARLHEAIALRRAGIEVPILVFGGTPPAEAERIVGQIAGARLVRLANCGHSSAIEAPEAVNRAIAEFLASVDAGRTTA